MTLKLIGLLAFGAASVATITAATAQERSAPNAYGPPAYRVAACPRDFWSELFGFRPNCSVPAAPAYRPSEDPRALVQISGLNGI